MTVHFSEVQKHTTQDKPQKMPVTPQHRQRPQGHDRPQKIVIQFRVHKSTSEQNAEIDYRKCTRHHWTVNHTKKQVMPFCMLPEKFKKTEEEQMATTKKDKDVVVLDAIDIKTAEVTIIGDTDLILNKTAASYERECIAVAAGKTITKDEPNYWEDVLTSVRWSIPFPKADTRELTEEDYKYMLEHGKPCISAYGLYKSFGDAVVRNEIDTYATKIKNAVSVLSENDRIPISFATASIEEKLMPLKKGGHTVAVLNRFSGWSATFTIRYTENVYNREKILNIINLAGFGLGIGSGRPSGYGRYHIESVR